MKKIFICVAVMAMTSTAFAQKIKVRRVKGNQAVVEFGGGTLQPGQVYELMSEDQFGSENPGAQKRDYVLGLNLSFYSTKSDEANSSNLTEVTLSSRIGWNWGAFEAGPLLSYRSSDSSGYNQTLVKFGGFMDYNFIPNIPGEIFLYGIGSYLAAGQSDNGAGLKGSIVELSAGPFVKWFFTGSSYAVRFDASYFYQRTSFTAADTTSAGVGVTAGIQAYF